jgi:hypothetical protein
VKKAIAMIMLFTIIMGCGKTTQLTNITPPHTDIKHEKGIVKQESSYLKPTVAIVAVVSILAITYGIDVKNSYTGNILDLYLSIVIPLERIPPPCA